MIYCILPGKIEASRLLAFTWLECMFLVMSQMVNVQRAPEGIASTHSIDLLAFQVYFYLRYTKHSSTSNFCTMFI